MGTFQQDVRYGLRILARNPGFTAVAVATLALGIGANTAIFSVVDGVLLRPLPYRDSNRLVVVEEKRGGGTDLSAPDFLEVQRENQVFEGMAAVREANFNLSGGDRPERVDGAVVTINTLDLFAANPMLGRGFLPEDAGSGGNRAVVLGYNLWRGHFGGNPAVVGEKVTLNAEPYTVIGVMPKGFAFPEGAQLWVPPRFAVPEHPLRPTQDPSADQGAHYFETYARLLDGVSIAQARANVDAIFARILKQNPDSELKGGSRIVTLQENRVGDVRPALLVALGAVALVLLIACVNLANLLLARGSARQREFAIRAALGAGRGRVIRQLVTESLLLSFAGGGLGLAVAFWGFAPLAALVPSELRESIRFSLDLRVLCFSLGVSLLAGLAFGLAPALQSSRAALAETLKEGGRTSAGGAARHRVQRLLVVSETALALVLLIGAGLLTKSFLRLLAEPEGFSLSNLLTMGLSLPQARYPQPADRAAFVKQILDRVAVLPGVQSAGAGTRMPLNPGNSSRSIDIEGRPTKPENDDSIDYSAVSSGFFRTMGIPLLAGREFSERDIASGTGAVIISHAMAERYWHGQNPVGAHMRISDTERWSEIVGVVGDIRQHDLGVAPRPMFYAPYAQDPWPFLTVTVRTKTDPASLASAVQKAIQDVDRDEPVYRVRTYEDIVAASVSPRRFNMLLLGLFASLALALAAVGLFGVMSYFVSQRTHEIGIRMALGAVSRDVFKLVLGEALMLALAGVGLGIAGAWEFTRLLSSLLYGVRTTDAGIFLLASLILTGVALLASYTPARRAMKVDPIVALRYE